MMIFKESRVAYSEFCTLLARRCQLSLGFDSYDLISLGLIRVRLARC